MEPTKPSDPPPEGGEQLTIWPEPAPDPDPERGEGEFHLLPNLRRIRSMNRDELAGLVELVRAWDGPLVERFRAAAAERLQ